MENVSPSSEVKAVIDKYYPEGSEGREVYVNHVRAVAEVTAKIIDHNGFSDVDRQLAVDGAFLHDIGIFLTDAPSLCCYGSSLYIMHGVLGRDILLKEGLEKYAMFCERHVGTGVSAKFSAENHFPEPQRDMFPITKEEIIVCYADKFFSKSSKNLMTPKPMAKILEGIGKYGERELSVFKDWCNIFGFDYIYE